MNNGRFPRTSFIAHVFFPSSFSLWLRLLLPFHIRSRSVGYLAPAGGGGRVRSGAGGGAGHGQQRVTGAALSCTVTADTAHRMRHSRADGHAVIPTWRHRPLDTRLDTLLDMLHKQDKGRMCGTCNKSARTGQFSAVPVDIGCGRVGVCGVPGRPSGKQSWQGADWPEWPDSGSDALLCGAFEIWGALQT